MCRTKLHQDGFWILQPAGGEFTKLAFQFQDTTVLRYHHRSKRIRGFQGCCHRHIHGIVDLHPLLFVFAFFITPVALDIIHFRGEKDAFTGLSVFDADFIHDFLCQVVRRCPGNDGDIHPDFRFIPWNDFQFTKLVGEPDPIGSSKRIAFGVGTFLFNQRVPGAGFQAGGNKQHCDGDNGMGYT